MNKHLKNHRIMWEELARTGESHKATVIERLGLPRVHVDCYACESTPTEWCDCGKCPLEWDKKHKSPEYKCEFAINSPYRRWDNAKTQRTRKKYANIIAKMKWHTK